MKCSFKSGTLTCNNDKRLNTARELSGGVFASQLEGWVVDPRPLSKSPQRSLGKSVHLNRAGKKQISGFGLPPNDVDEIEK